MSGIAALGALAAWVPRSATAVGLAAGPLVVVGYLAGSIPFAYLLSRRRLRRQLDDAALAQLPADAMVGEDHSARPAAQAGVLVGATTLAASTLAWQLTLTLTPGGNTFSAVGTYSNQALGAWVSVALWTGMAAVVGHAGPVWNSFWGGSGVPPALALAAAYLPGALVVTTAAYLVTFGVTRQFRTSLLVALPVMVGSEYLAWLADLQAGWGIINGPEATLWTAALAATLFARNQRGSSPRSAS